MRRPIAPPAALKVTGQLQNGTSSSNSVRHCAGFVAQLIGAFWVSFLARNKGAELSQPASTSSASGTSSSQAQYCSLMARTTIPWQIPEPLLLQPQVRTKLNGSNITTAPQLSPNTVRDAVFFPFGLIACLFWFLADAYSGFAAETKQGAGAYSCEFALSCIVCP
jgi:hypothetical protein